MAMNTEALMDKLFRWKTSVDVGGTKLYIRVVSDQVIDDARRYALLESRKLRRDLRNRESDDYLIYIDPLEDLDDDMLRNLITNNEMRDVMRGYLNANPRPVLPPLGENPSQEEQENYENEKEVRDAEYLQSMEAYVEAWREDFYEKLTTRDREYLWNLARNHRVDQVCEEKFSQVFEEHVVASSVYVDDKYRTRAFTLQEYRELPAEVRTKLRDSYDSMSISADDIKN